MNTGCVGMKYILPDGNADSLMGNINSQGETLGKNLECSPEFRASNFGLTSQPVQMPNGGTRNDTAHTMTRDGFVFLAMGFTGKEAAQWKEAYINAFNAMEAEIAPH